MYWIRRVLGSNQLYQSIGTKPEPKKDKVEFSKNVYMSETKNKTEISKEESQQETGRFKSQLKTLNIWNQWSRGILDY